MSENFNLYSQYYDVLYKDKAYFEETAYISKMLRQFNENTKTILELGCGSGNHAQFLSQMEFEITGIDRSEFMIAQAKEKKIINFTPIVGNITDFQVDKKFDAVISLFHVISYLTKNEELISTFKNVNKHLEIDGIFLFDCWFTPSVYHLGPESRVKKFENDKMKVERISNSIMDIHENTILVNFDIQIEEKATNESSFLNEKHLMRHFSIPEITLLAESLGFKLVTCEELMSGTEPSLDTWAVCFVLQKINEIA